jgi:hypothetical protein
MHWLLNSSIRYLRASYVSQSFVNEYHRVRTIVFSCVSGHGRSIQRRSTSEQHRTNVKFGLSSFRSNWISYDWFVVYRNKFINFHHYFLIDDFHLWQIVSFRWTHTHTMSSYVTRHIQYEHIVISEHCEWNWDNKSTGWEDEHVHWHKLDPRRSIVYNEKRLESTEGKHRATHRHECGRSTTRNESLERIMRIFCSIARCIIFKIVDILRQTCSYVCAHGRTSARNWVTFDFSVGSSVVVFTGLFCCLSDKMINHRNRTRQARLVPGK